jgi:hypothetical protein
MRSVLVGIDINYLRVTGWREIEKAAFLKLSPCQDLLGTILFRISAL